VVLTTTPKLVEFDDGFQTVKQEANRWKSQWQAKTGFAPVENSDRRGRSSHDQREKHTETEENSGDGNKRSKKRKRSNVKGTQVEITSDNEPEIGSNNDPRVARTQPQRESTTTTNFPSEGAHENELEQNETSEPPAITTRSGRTIKKKRLYDEEFQAMEYLLSECDEIIASQTIVAKDNQPITVNKAVVDPDTMYHHQAMKEPDSDEFRKAMVKEVTDQQQNGNFTIIPRSQLPTGATVLPAVWQMKRKRDIRTREIKKYKARLNIDGSKMKPGKHYDPNQTYAPVASWNSIRLLLTMTVVHGWTTRQID